MQNFLTYEQLIELTFFSGLLYHEYEKRVTGDFLLKAPLRLLDISIIIGAIYLTFVKFVWWKAILFLILTFIISSILVMFIGKFLSSRILLSVSLLGFVVSSYLLFHEIF